MFEACIGLMQDGKLTVHEFFTFFSQFLRVLSRLGLQHSDLGQLVVEIAAQRLSGNRHFVVCHSAVVMAPRIMAGSLPSS